MKMKCPDRKDCDHAQSCKVCNTELCNKEDNRCQYEGAYHITSGVYCPDCWTKTNPLMHDL